MQRKKTSYFLSFLFFVFLQSSFADTPIRKGFFRSGNHTLSYVDRGPQDAPPIVLLHGFALTQSMWTDLSKFLSKDYRVITYDLRGHGESELGTGYYFMAHYVDDFYALLDHLHLNEVVLGGFSMGGYTVFNIMETDSRLIHPKVAAIMAMNTDPSPDDNVRKNVRARTLDMLQSIDGWERFVKSSLALTLAKETFIDAPHVVTFTEGLLRKNTKLGLCANLAVLASRPDRREDIGKIKVPSLFLAGEKDGIIKPEAVELAAKSVRGSQFHLIPASGHLSPLEQPKLVHSIVGSFLKGLQWGK